MNIKVLRLLPKPIRKQIMARFITPRHWWDYHPGFISGVNGAYVSSGITVFPCGQTADEEERPYIYPETMDDGIMNCHCEYCKLFGKTFERW